MKQAILASILLVGVCAIARAQAVTPQQVKGNKIVTVQLLKLGDGYYLNFQNHTTLQLSILVECSGESETVDVGYYEVAYSIAASMHSRVTIKTLNVKSSAITFEVRK